MTRRRIRFGVIGCGLMGREFASAASRWLHLLELNVEPVITAVCDTDPAAMDWFKQNVPTVQFVTKDYHDILANPEIEAIYCAVPHNLHEKFYIDIIRAGKHLLGEKPFGIDLKANQAILQALQENPQVVVRCSSEIPFYPGAYKVFQFVREGRLGRIIEVEAGFWHSSDLDPNKPINWKRQMATNGEYGCMGDLGMYVLHLPLRFGWKPNSVRALLSNLVTERPNQEGQMVPCETWDNAILACDVQTDSEEFPMVLSMKRIAPGHANTWFLRIHGMNGSIEYSTQNPKQVKMMDYSSGGEQVWTVVDVPYQTAYPTITGGIFEFGFSDSILQMWAAFCDEIANGTEMHQPLHCVTPEETAVSHALFTAALQSQKTGETVKLS
ncbi:oxidoreductase [Collibacillus ludicampi]|uniref:Oxidoreductase n=1 Tax=Collibacillus ludicampi TaxID=2771369 RepID=A0AAV4LAJ7_9BACL|nr:Gfo/Idh/MocA family oxidoreductase [Collibacillus ludicampi]GIM44718.1 oxidoreductase [Collibacillus ludicampi]